MNKEFPLAAFAANEGEPKEVEGFRFFEPAPCALGNRKATERNQAGLVRMQRQRELPQPFTHCIPKAPSISFLLEARHEVSRTVESHPPRGRQLVDTPLINPSDNRMVPNTFEGVQLVTLPDSTRKYDYSVGYFWTIKPRDWREVTRSIGASRTE